MEEFMTIKELIRMVQDELIMAQKERVYEEITPLFETSELELELNTILTESNNGKLKLSVLPLSTDVSSNCQEQYIQKIKLKFKVVHDDEINFLPQNTFRVDGRFPEWGSDD